MRFHQDIDPIFTPSDGALPGFEEDIRRLMKSEEGLVLVALDEGRVVGFSSSEVRQRAKVWKFERFGAIDTVAVTALYRRRGIGEEMLLEILKWFQSRRIDRVELEVVAKNRLGYSFWKKHGFTDYRHRLFLQV
jgi:ribosomal protein S18 acetylase RimI-like enzyme